ncbi:Transcription regulator XNP/ATRX [Abeliophyllum distichum]|uniref:Transcription regulator XNP/ATRX n=1 Tax=Abeliophyllum distichum TaxID=126358 RepID=A0ABD1UPE2_9LAMI
MLTQRLSWFKKTGVTTESNTASDTKPELGQETGVTTESNTASDTMPENCHFFTGNSSADKLMQSLISRHHPRWISNYHEHETLLQENEEEKLSKEEQDMAWEVYQKTLEWEEVRRGLPDECTVEQQQKPVAESAFDRKTRAFLGNYLCSCE